MGLTAILLKTQRFFGLASVIERSSQGIDGKDLALQCLRLISSRLCLDQRAV